jgi:enoyl-CoA hydratase/carnithine racemase
MAYQTIRYEVIDSIAILTLDRPDVSNGFNIPMCEEILNAIQLAENDETDGHFVPSVGARRQNGQNRRCS